MIEKSLVHFLENSITQFSIVVPIRKNGRKNGKILGTKTVAIIEVDDVKLALRSLEIRKLKQASSLSSSERSKASSDQFRASSEAGTELSN